MAEQPSARQIVKDWKDAIWFKEKPDTVSARTECYDILANTLKEYGYDLNVFTEGFKDYIRKSTVGSDKKKNHKDRLNAAEIYLDKMITKHFGTVTKFKRSSENSVTEEKISDIKPSEQSTKVSDEINPSKSKFREYVPDPETLEFIEKNFRFEGTDEDFE